MIRPRETRLLVACAALAGGEACAALIPGISAAWLFVGGVSFVIALAGYGFSIRFWPYVCLFFLGGALCLHASTEREEMFRVSPWMRGARARSTEVVSAFPSVERDISRRIGLGLENLPEIAQLNRAILVGERSRMPRQAKRVFAESGTIHVFAISGLHVMIFANLLVVLSIVFFVPTRFRGLFVVPLLWAYVALIGSTPSAVRAALMASVFFFAPLFYRQGNGLHSWIIAFFVVHLFSPLSVSSVGSVLSFAVMLALVLASRLARQMRGRWKSVLFLGFSAWAAGVPIVAHVFGRLTPGGFFANLLLVPVAAFSVSCGAVGVFTSYLSSTLAAHFNLASGMATEAMVLIAHVVSRLPGADIEIEPWDIWECVLWYVGLVLFYYWIHLRLKRRNLV